MTTKAELFRYLAERAGTKRTPSGRMAREDARVPGEPPASLHAGRKAGYALEHCEGRPSRKSTRRSANRQKNDVQFRLKRCVAEVRSEGRRGRPR